MLLTREGDYAVRCVLEVARNGHTSAGEVARRQGISPAFLGKIVQSLARGRILATRRGVGGGISLARPPELITLLQIVEAVEGPVFVSGCVSEPPECDLVEDCPAYPFWCRVQEALGDILSVSVQEMLDGSAVQVAPAHGAVAAPADGEGGGS